MAAEDQADAFEPIAFVVSKVCPVKSKNIFALLDVEMRIAGASFWIKGLQARRIVTGGTSVHLRTYKDVDGSCRSAIALPDELREPLVKTVLDLLVDEGHAKQVISLP